MVIGAAARAETRLHANLLGAAAAIASEQGKACSGDPDTLRAGSVAM
jgi:hypothetical protein